MSARYTLAYDGLCGFCENTAKNVASQVDGHLAIEPLQSDHIREVHDSLGLDHPDRPVLIREDSLRGPRIFTGMQLNAELVSAFGFGKSLQMLKAVGDSRRAPGASRISRSGFIRAAIGVGVVSMATLFARPASASLPEWTATAGRGERREISEKEIVSLLEDFRRTEDFAPVAEIESTLRGVSLYDDTSKPHFVGFETPLPEGAVRKSVASTVDGFTIVYHRLIEPSGEWSEAARAAYLETEGGEPVTAHLLYELADSSSWSTPASVIESIATGEESISTMAACGPACDKKGRCYHCVCTKADAKCIHNCCSSCAVACIGGAKVCLACALVVCAACAAWSGDCCTASKCKYKPSATC